VTYGALSLLLLTSSAYADEPRPIRGSAGVGSVLLLSGEAGDASRLDVEVDVEPGHGFGHYGALVALRAFDRHHDGLLCGGLMFEAAAARPRLVIDLHADVGVDLDISRPVVGAGVRTLLGIVGPLGVAFDSGAYVVIAGAQDTRLVLAGDAMIVARW
jgi:hypothetical protein